MPPSILRLWQLATERRMHPLWALKPLRGLTFRRIPANQECSAAGVGRRSTVKDPQASAVARTQAALVA